MKYTKTTSGSCQNQKYKGTSFPEAGKGPEEHTNCSVKAARATYFLNCILIIP